MLYERRDPDDRVMPPVRPAVALPPGTADRVGPHAVAHAELEDPRERARARQPYDQLLQDADLRVRLHGLGQPHDRGTGHHAVGVEHQQEVEVAPTPLKEVPKVAGLVPVMLRSAAVLGANAVPRPSLPAGEGS